MRPPAGIRSGHAINLTVGFSNTTSSTLRRARLRSPRSRRVQSMNDWKTRDRILQLCERLYWAIEAFPIADIPFPLQTEFSGFPNGCCGDTCYLLEQWLTENGESGFKRFCGTGTREHPHQTHAWLERGGLIVDITRGQYSRSDEVYVGEDRTLLDVFVEIEPQAGTLRDLGEDDPLVWFYQSLRGRIPRIAD